MITPITKDDSDQTIEGALLSAALLAAPIDHRLVVRQMQTMRQRHGAAEANRFAWELVASHGHMDREQALGFIPKVRSILEDGTIIKTLDIIDYNDELRLQITSLVPAPPVRVDLTPLPR